MQVQDQTQCSFEVTSDSILDSIYESISDCPSTRTPSSIMPRIPRLPRTLREKPDYEKYYVPMFVSIGPYHFGEPKLQLVEKRKPVIAMKLFSNNKGALRSLFEKLGEPETVKELRSFYEENSTTKYCDKVFTKIMLLDGCFILYIINFFFGGLVEDDSEFKSNEIFFVRRDLYLLENQIPLKVLKEGLRFWRIDLLEYIKRFIHLSSIVRRKKSKRNWLDNLIEIFSTNEGVGDEDEDDEEPSHLLGALHGKHSRIVKAPRRTSGPLRFKGHNFRNVNELVDVGINFKPIKDTISMAHIEYVKGWWGFSATVKLPPIAVSDYSKPMLLNLMAYERCNCSIDDSWVSSYVSFLNSLIDNVEDVKVLRKAWVLQNFLGSDQEVVKLFDEIGTDLIENSSAYTEATHKIQGHYESRSNITFGQLKKEYFKSPWTFFALLGALIALFLTGVQTYFTVWSPKSTCDDLCMFLKMNHHL